MENKNITELDVIALTRELGKKIQRISREMRRCYGEIMSNESMMAYNDAKDSYDVLMNRISAIIQKSFEGEDPETADYSPSCSGSCATCGGCG